MSAGYEDSLEEVKFLDSALKSSRPNVSIENKAIEIYRTFYKRGHFFFLKLRAYDRIKHRLYRWFHTKYFALFL